MRSFDAAGGICGGRRVHVKEPLVGGIARGVAIAVGCVLRRTECGAFFASRRLRELPDFGIGDAARWRARGILRRRTPRRWRARIVVDPVEGGAAANIVADIVGSNDRNPMAFADGHSRAIHASAITNPCQLVNPGAQISVIHGRQAAALFYIQKNYGVRRKAFFFCGGFGEARVGGSPFPGLSFELTGVVDALRPCALEFAALRAAVKNQKAEPWERRSSRFPSQVFVFSPGGGLSQ